MSNKTMKIINCICLVLCVLCAISGVVSERSDVGFYLMCTAGLFLNAYAIMRK